MCEQSMDGKELFTASLFPPAPFSMTFFFSLSLIEIKLKAGAISRVVGCREYERKRKEKLRPANEDRGTL